MKTKTPVGGMEILQAWFRRWPGLADRITVTQAGELADLIDAPRQKKKTGKPA